MVRSIALPTLESAVMPRAVARHVVSASGNSTFACAWPRASVRRSAIQNTVSGNALRTLGSTIFSGFMMRRALAAAAPAPVACGACPPRPGSSSSATCRC